METTTAPMADLDHMLVCISKFADEAGLYDEAVEIYVHNNERMHLDEWSRTERNLRILAETRALLLAAGFPVEDVARFDR